jgi:hypothetical protein
MLEIYFFPIAEPFKKHIFAYKALRAFKAFFSSQNPSTPKWKPKNTKYFVWRDMNTIFKI